MELKQLTADRKRIVKLPVGTNEKGEVELSDLVIWHKPITPQIDDRLQQIADEIDRQELAKRRAEMVKEEGQAKNDGKENVEPSAESSQPSKPVLVAQLAFLLTRWGVTKDGAELPASEELLMSLEWETLGLIRDAIFQPIFPKMMT